MFGFVCFRNHVIPFLLTNPNQFDAPIGYPSITANYTSQLEKGWFNPEQGKLYQFMGKDNVYFHTVFFPSILLADGRPWTMLHHISTTGKANSLPKFVCSHQYRIS